MPISAYTYARHHISTTIAKQFVLSPKPKNGKTLQAGKTFLGVEVIPSSSAEYPTVNTYALEIIGFCDQYAFSEKVKRPRKKIRSFKEHPIASECIGDLYKSISKYRKENLGATTRGGDYDNYEPPTMVAKNLDDTQKPYILFQANETLDDGLSWKNGKSEIVWFELQSTPTPSEDELRTENANAPHEIDWVLKEKDLFSAGTFSYEDMKAGALRRVQDLQAGELISLVGEVIEAHQLSLPLNPLRQGNQPPKVDVRTRALVARVVGFAKAKVVSPFVQPKTFQELEHRLSHKTKVTIHNPRYNRWDNKRMAGFRWDAERSNFLGKGDLMHIFVSDKMPVYRSWDDIPQTLRNVEGGIGDYAPKLMLILEDLDTTEIIQPVEVHLPSLEVLRYNKPMRIYSLFNQMEDKQCHDCAEYYPDVEFASVTDTDCTTCVYKQQVLADMPKALHPIIARLYQSAIEEITFDETGLYIKVAWGNGTIGSYVRTLDQTFVRQRREWIDDLEGDFSFACDAGGQAREYVSEEHRATLRLIYDDINGMEAQLWVDPELETTQSTGGDQ